MLPHHLGANMLAHATEASAQPEPPTAGCHPGWRWWLSFCSNLWNPVLPTVTTRV